LGDMGDIYRLHNEEKKKRHAEWHKKNMEIFEKADGIMYEIKNNGESVVIPAGCGKPQVVFFPSTGRWRARGKTFSGGAKSFINWYRKQ